MSTLNLSTQYSCKDFLRADSDSENSQKKRSTSFKHNQSKVPHKQSKRSAHMNTDRGYALRRVLLMLGLISKRRLRFSVADITRDLNDRMLEDWSTKTIERDLIILTKVGIVTKEDVKIYRYRGMEVLDYLEQWV